MNAKARQLGMIRTRTTAEKRLATGPTVVTMADAAHWRRHYTIGDTPPSMAHVELCRYAERVVRGLSRKPGVIEQIRAATSATEIQALLGDHLTHGSKKARRRWGTAAEARLAELRGEAVRP